MEQSVGDVVDESADVVLVGEERCELKASHRLRNIDVWIREGLQRPPGFHAQFGFEFVSELGLINVLQSTVGVVNEDDLAGAEKPL